MKNILYIATSDIHLKTFHVPHLEWLAAQGHNVDLAFEDRGGIRFDMARHQYRLAFPRRLNAVLLKKAYSSLKHLIDNGDYDILHCHTPIPSALTRLAARQWRKQGGKVLYTAHGFHFYKGGPIKNWLVYYPVELLLSHLTDCIVTINAEDFSHTKRLLWGSCSARIPGIGIQERGFCKASGDERKALRAQLGFDEDDFILLYTAEFIPRKNHRFIIDATAQMSAAIPNLKIVFLGRGELLDQCRRVAAELVQQNTLHFMGFREDVPKFAKIADLGISASRHEGLGIALLEQMMCGVPVVASADKGHREFIDHGKTGFIFPQGDSQAFISQIKALYADRALREAMGAHACETAQNFTLRNSLRAMTGIYQKVLC